MEEDEKSNEKGKIASSFSEKLRRRSEETVFQSLNIGDDASWKSVEERESERRRREVNEIFINNDVLEEIMTRLPVKTLIRFQAVSKDLRHIITSRSFKEGYLLHQKTLEPKFLCIYEDKSWYTPNFALKTMSLEWSSTCLVDEEEGYHTKYEESNLLVSRSLDGLFLLFSSTDFTQPINVINAATRWSWTLPLAKTQIEHSLDNNKVQFPHPEFGKDAPGLGKDYITGTYKLVWLQNIDNTSLCEVFDFGPKQWRSVIPPHPPHVIEHEQIPIFVNGWFYWFSQDNTKLVAFDLHLEVFRIVPNPIIHASSSVGLHMENVNDDHRLVWMSETTGDGLQHVWRLTNYNNTGGTLSIVDKIFTFDLNKINSTWFDSHYSSRLRINTISKNSDKVMLSKSRSQNLLLFQHTNPTSIRYDIFSYYPFRPSDSLVLPYFPSLVSLI
ncbi:hypothetical protein CARUB_v10018695mg [Capsella rubella]|uniref:F-box domain-containing protein n=1 Tax=Capsella rubella TaxID=81985 RepID=R0HN64_9BRAS|nr:putative F-box protein At2g02030 [Capsella rubella]EOA25363.1 hypothetical protein CARUB_v10018695mg [Capsella rubella]